MKFANLDLAKPLMGFFAKQTNPFKQLVNDNNILGKEYQDVVNIAVLGYQAYFYLNKIRQIYGVHVYEKVQAQVYQQMQLNEHGSDLIASTIKLIEIAINMGELEVTDENTHQTIPVEMNIAVTVLLCLPGSPHYAPSKKLREEAIYQIEEDIDDKLSRYLCLGRERLLSWITSVSNPFKKIDYSKLTMPCR